MKKLSIPEAYTISLLAQTTKGEERLKAYYRYIKPNLKGFSKNAKEFINDLMGMRTN